MLRSYFDSVSLKMQKNCNNHSTFHKTELKKVRRQNYAWWQKLKNVSLLIATFFVKVNIFSDIRKLVFQLMSCSVIFQMKKKKHYFNFQFCELDSTYICSCFHEIFVENWWDTMWKLQKFLFHKKFRENDVQCNLEPNAMISRFFFLWKMVRVINFRNFHTVF